MKKLLLGALLVMGSMSYGVTSGNVTPVEITIRANVVGSGSITVTGDHLTGTDLVYDGSEEILNVVFTGNHTTLNEITIDKELIMMTNGDNENFSIAVTTDTKSTVTLGSHATADMADVMAGNYTGTISIGAVYN